MRKLILFIQAMFLACGIWSQNCPVILNCLPGTQTSCDFSENDSLLWRDAPYTWSPVFSSADLYEGSVDLNIKVLGCPGGGPVTVSFLLYLDLDSDNLDETVVNSALPPLPGRVLFNSAFNPNNPSGDTLWFDTRPLPAAQLFQFSLETQQIGDTTFASVKWITSDNPGSSIMPRLPEGKHRIVWTVLQDGSARFCQHNFRIKDCLIPEVFCLPALTYSFPQGDPVVTISVENLQEDAMDNISPDNYLMFGIGPESGANFPLDSTGAPIDTLHFYCDDAGAQVLKLWVRDQAGNQNTCLSEITILDDPYSCPFPFPEMAAFNLWNGDTIGGMHYTMEWVEQDSLQHAYDLPLNPVGFGLLDTLPLEESFTITPYNTTPILNGVTTFDLLLISKHILGIEPLNTPWKIIAADVNKNNSITNFDILELRRLILGVYDTLPNNRPWRFFTGECILPSNPFSAMCPEQLTLTTLPLTNYDPRYFFYGVKTGDVNGTAQMNSLVPSTDRGALSLRHEAPVLEPLQESDIPVYGDFYSGIQGFQLELCANPDWVQILDVRPGSFPGMDMECIAPNQAGGYRVSWFYPENTPVDWAQTPLFYVRVRAKGAGRAMLSLSEKAIPSEAYLSDGSRFKLDFQSGRSAENNFKVMAPQPNPSSTDVRWPFQVATGETLQLSLLTVQGQLVYHTNQYFEAGYHEWVVPAETFKSEAVYLWRLQSNDRMYSGKIMFE